MEGHTESREGKWTMKCGQSNANHKLRRRLRQGWKNAGAGLYFLKYSDTKEFAFVKFVISK